MKQQTTICTYCGQVFTGKTRKARFCSASCRVMAARKRVYQNFAEKKQHKSYFESENEKLRIKKAQLLQAQIQFDSEKQDFQEIFDKYMPQIILQGDLSQQNSTLKHSLELTENECRRLEILLRKHGIDPLSV